MAKGQSSLELLVTVGVILAFTIPVLFLILSISSVGYEDTAKAQADASARTLADAMNSVYAQGPGAEREILLNVPPSTETVYVSGGEVVVRIRTSGGSFDAVSPTIASIAPNFPQIQDKGGLFKVVLRTNPRGEVELSDPNAP
ncbi:MAG: hypothetical protein V1827_04220 [Candidatus Micrarchaeota archaeon]